MENFNNIPFTTENVEKALLEFYSSSHTNFKPQLDQWLKLAQNSKDAWNFSWDLLQQTKSNEIQFFGANSLYNKVSKYIQELETQENIEKLKNKILEKLLSYSNNRLIQRKLNSTLAKLALYLITDEWINCVDDIINLIKNLSSYENISKINIIQIVLDLLTLIPEEFQTLNIGKVKRLSIKSSLVQQFPKVKQFLNELFQQFQQMNDENLIENGIKCLNSWIEFGILYCDLDCFLSFLFYAIYNETLFEATCECLTAIFSLPENTKYSNSIFTYLPNILNLTNLLKKFIDTKDTDGCVILTKLVLAYGENQIKSMFEIIRFGDQNAKHLLFNFMNFIMNLSSIPGNFPVDEESTDLTFVFWYSFQDELLAVDDEAGTLKQIFKQYFLNLLEIFVKKLQLSDSYDSWSEDEKERLRCYRIDIGDTMVYMISIIGDYMIEFIIKSLIESVEKKLDWKLQEALIYMLQSVVCELNESTNVDYGDTSESASHELHHQQQQQQRDGTSTDDAYLIAFTNLLPHINYCNKHILSTTLTAIGSMGTWFEHNTHALPNVVSLCLLGLKTESVVAQSASFALKDIINDCDLATYADDIINTCNECLRNGTLLQHSYDIRLMAIIGLCVADLLQHDTQKAFNWINVILSPLVNKLEELSKLQSVDKMAQVLTCHILNLISQMLTSLTKRNHGETSFVEITQQEKTALTMIIASVFPIYKTFVKRHSTLDAIVIDKIFESISLILVNGNSDCLEIYLNEIIELVYTLDENSWRRYTYEVCRQVLAIWWRNDSYKNTLFNLFQYANQHAMKLMSNGLSWFHEHTDIVEQYSTCLAKLLKLKFYDLFNKLDRNTLVCLLQFGQLGLQLPEQYTLRAVSTFVEEFLHYTKSDKNLIELMEQNLQNLLQIVIIGISGALPRHLIDLLASVLYACFKDYAQQTNTILNNLFTKTDFPQHAVQLTKEKKLSFLKSAIGESNNKRKFKEIVSEFSLTCRGLVNTDYAKDTTQKYF